MGIRERGPHYEVEVSEHAIYWYHVLGNGIGSKMMLMAEAHEVLPLMLKAIKRWDEEHGG